MINKLNIKVKEMVLAGFFMMISLVSLAPVTAQAQADFLGFRSWNNGTSCNTLPCPDFKRDDIPKVGVNVLQWIILSAGYVSTVFLLVGAFRYVTSQGSPDQISKAKSTMINAVIGMIISFGAVILIDTIYSIVTGGFLGGVKK